MIENGEKKEEYREVKTYWERRLMRYEIVSRNNRASMKVPVAFKHFDFIEFKNGYGKNAPTLLVECKGIDIDSAKPEWSDNSQGLKFVIKLGNVIKKPE